MVDGEKSFLKRAKATVLWTTVGVGSAILLGSTFTLLAPRPASATPQYAQQTGLACGRCHENPSGGGKLKAFGEKFKENDHKVPK